MKLLVGISVKLQRAESPVSVLYKEVCDDVKKNIKSYSPHLQEDLSELCSHLHQWVQVTRVWCYTHGVKVVWFKCLVFPVTPVTQHKED